MKSNALDPQDYINSLPQERKAVVAKMRELILENLPKGFKEEIGSGMLAYVVPHSLYPKGYHCNSELPLPFINLGNQKNHIALYHMGIYADQELYEWFTVEFFRITGSKPDIGKSCIRFKMKGAVPYELIGELASKRTPEEWITIYESRIRR